MCLVSILSFRPKSRNLSIPETSRDVSTLLDVTSRLELSYNVLMAQVTVETIKNGPYILTGEVELIDADGNKYPVEKRMALCRCGASTEKPFCDGTHSKIGFQAAEKAVPESKE
jgi:CDGSH-type Zn-finger protein